MRVENWNIELRFLEVEHLAKFSSIKAIFWMLIWDWQTWKCATQISHQRRPDAQLQKCNPPKSLVFSSFQLNCRELLCLSSRPWVKKQWRKKAAYIHSLKKVGYKVAATSGPTWDNSVGAVLPAGLPDGWLRLFQKYVTILLLSLLSLSPASFPSQVLFLNTYFTPQIHFSICF